MAPDRQLPTRGSWTDAIGVFGIRSSHSFLAAPPQLDALSDSILVLGQALRLEDTLLGHDSTNDSKALARELENRLRDRGRSYHLFPEATSPELAHLTG